MKKKANWLDPSTTAENEVLPGYLKWAWTSRGLSLALNVILIMQLTYYFVPTCWAWGQHWSEPCFWHPRSLTV